MALNWLPTLAMVATLTAVHGDCPTSWIEFRGSCYYGSDISFTWADARKICKELHPEADLPTIHSMQEEAFIDEVFPGLRWIGFNDIENEGQFKWANGDQVDYTMWDCGEPNNANNEDCACINTIAQWSDYSCDLEHNFVCKMQVDG